jgi:hypothetical protein
MTRRKVYLEFIYPELVEGLKGVLLAEQEKDPLKEGFSIDILDMLL